MSQDEYLNKFNQLPDMIKCSIEQYAKESYMNPVSLFKNIYNSTGDAHSLSKMFEIPHSVISKVQELKAS